MRLSMRVGPAIALLLGAALTVGASAACTAAGPEPAPSTMTGAPAPSPTPATSTGSSDGQSTPPTAPSPTYFTPTDTSSYTLTGRITVDQARQDPFSNLLKRGALHQQPVTLDVVGTPDRPVQPGASVTMLLGTCRCDQRGSGLQLTVTDGTAVGVLPSGDVTIRGTFRPVVTASDAITLNPVS